MFITTAGGVTTSASIVDGEIVNADINASAAIAQSKIAESTDINTDLVAVTTGTSSPLSLTTVANQRVIVIAKGNFTGQVAVSTLTLQYNSVTKDTCLLQLPGGSNDQRSFTMMYTEIPGAATQNITITNDGAGTISQLVITVIKIK